MEEIQKFMDQDVRDNRVKCRAEVDEEHPDVAVWMFQVGRCCELRWRLHPLWTCLPCKQTGVDRLTEAGLL